MNQQRLVFVENGAQAAALANDPTTLVVAVTGEAVQALEAGGIAHRPISAFGDLTLTTPVEKAFVRESLALLEDLESYVRERSATVPAGAITDYAYHLYCSTVTVAARASLMLGAIRALTPDRVATFTASADRWFGDYYEVPPWEIVVEASAGPLERLPAVVAPGTPAPQTLRRGFRRFVPRLRLRSRHARLRLLFVGRPDYDWRPVVRALERERRAECPWIDMHVVEPGRDWTFALGNPIDYPFVPDPKSRSEMATLFDDWLSQRGEKPAIHVNGLDVFPGVAPSLRAMASIGPELARHARTVATRELERVRPEAVCIFAIPWLSGMQLARVAREYGVPVVAYQHGGTYGTHRTTSHELAEWACADYFLTYGSGITPPRDPEVPPRATFVPVGSAAIATASRRRRRRYSRSVRVLWVAERPTANALSFDLGEDTRRFFDERDALRILTESAGISLTYRPTPGVERSGGIVDWLEATDARLVVDAETPIADLVAAADLVITDTHSGTVWNEVLGCGCPLVLFAEAGTLRPAPGYAEALATACQWYTDRDAFLDAVHELSSDPIAFVRRLARRDASAFVEAYVLHRGDPVQNVLAFFEALRK
jgi:hypothetical protein